MGQNTEGALAAEKAPLRRAEKRKDMNDHILYNPLAGGGSGRARAEKLAQSLPGGTAQLTDLTQLHDYGAFFASVPAGDRIFLTGGDGTLNRFLNDTADIPLPNELWYAPTGTGNDFWTDLGRKPGDAPYSLLDYFPKGFLCFIDESHVTVPQIRAMYNGDRARKEQLVEYGFRLPSAFDNRPLLFEEFEQRIGQTIFVSATPGPYEISHASQIVEQIIRPTGLLDPKIILRKATGQVDDLVGEIHQVVAKKQRVLVTTLTKRMAESLTEYLQSMDIRVRYLHSDVTTMDRMALIRGLRLGEYDVLVGINLLREGLDLPEVSLVAILDADKEGFLRSETSLVQTIGRAARNVDGRVIMYADVMTDSLMRAISETNRRRAIQEEYNRVHGITPESVRNAVHQVLEITKKAEESAPAAMSEDERNALMKQVEDQMLSAAKALDFEQAAKLRDQLLELKGEKPQAEQIQKKRRRTRESTRHH